MTELRVSPDFHLRVRVEPGDIDDLRHVSNIVYVRWVQDVAVAHSNAVGWTHEAYMKAGKIFIVRRHEIDYLHPALEGEELELITWVESWSGASSVRRTRIVRPEDGREIARAMTLWVLVSTTTGRPQRIPPEMVDAFTQKG
ncbi:MAG: acyl-CoA thioesterase [Myxococcaceae bacterium]|nr:acyl-CoA thioesterase [Myxococcaceae bacterium]